MLHSSRSKKALEVLREHCMFIILLMGQPQLKLLAVIGLRNMLIKLGLSCGNFHFLSASEWCDVWCVAARSGVWTWVCPVDSRAHRPPSTWWAWPLLTTPEARAGGGVTLFMRRRPVSSTTLSPYPALSAALPRHQPPTPSWNHCNTTYWHR